MENSWYRARVIDTEAPADWVGEQEGDVGEVVVVQLVDYGRILSVRSWELRELRPRFMHLPLQAMECCLHSVEPLGEGEADTSSCGGGDSSNNTRTSSSSWSSRASTL